MSSAEKELKRVVNLAMPFPSEVIAAYSRLGIVFTSGNLSKEAGIPRSTAKYYVNKMIKLRIRAPIQPSRAAGDIYEMLEALVFGAFLDPHGELLGQASGGNALRPDGTDHTI